jgi:methionine-S-sulfoxide reductase
MENPGYRDVCGGDTGHAEAVEIIYDPALISYEKLLDLFFRFHDPTQLNRQGPDIGDQYRSAIFFENEAEKKAAEKKIKELENSKRFHRPIVTQVIPLEKFYEAEAYHQKYYEKRKK